MSASRRDLALALSLVAALGSAASGEVQRLVRPSVAAGSYFPIQPGNHWVYEKQRPSGPTTWEVAVTETGASAPQRLYETITGYFSAARQVRVDGEDNVFEWSGEGLHEASLVRPGRTGRDPLGHPSRPGPARLAVPRLRDRLQARAREPRRHRGRTGRHLRERGPRQLVSPCADAGITSEWFAPGVGLVRRDETTFAGPVSSVLLRADIGSGACRGPPTRRRSVWTRSATSTT